MNTKTLIDTAVINSTTAGRKGLADRLFAHWFNRLVYAQIWEDPVVDLAALELQPGARILTISSGGCNALAYLMADPAAVHAVDLNATHLAMLEIKKTALRCLPTYPDVLAFLGDADQADNRQRYHQHIAPNLDGVTRRYWEARGISGRRRYHYFTTGAYRKGLLGDFIGLAHVFSRCLGGNLQKMTTAKSHDEQQALYDQHVAPLFQNWLVRFLSRQPMALYSLGIPPSQFDAIARDAGGDVTADFAERMRRLACDWPIAENCFAGQAFGRRYDTATQSALPMYLQAEHHSAIRERIDRVHAHHTTLTAFLHQQPAQSMDAYLFLDAQDWMDAAQLIELWQEVTRTAKPSARVVFRTGGSVSPLERTLPTTILQGWKTDPARNAALFRQDRSAIYGGLHLYHRC